MASDVFVVLGSYIPLLVFLLVVIVVYAVLAKTKILGDKIFVQLAVAFLLGMILITFSMARGYLAGTAQWFAIFMVAIFFILALIAFSGKEIDFLKSWIGVFFVVLFIIVILALGYYVFLKGNSDFSHFIRVFANPQVYEALIFVIVGGIVAFILARS